MDRAVTYLENNREHMRYDKALEKGWPIATGMVEGACRFVIEDRFGITGARWSPDGADVVLKLRAVVVNGDLDDYMNYYKERYRARAPPCPLRRGHHRAPKPRRMTEIPGNEEPLRHDAPPAHAGCLCDAYRR